MGKSSAPQPKQARAKDTIAQLIAATDAAMREGGEASVRIQDISSQTGISIGSIYHHFGDRDGLIRATLVHNFAAYTAADLPRVKAFMERMSSKAEMAEHYDEMFAFVKQHFHHQSALERAAIVGNAAGRPKLREELAEVQHELNVSATEAMQIAADRQILKAHLNPRAAAMVVLGMFLGRALAELDNEPVADDDWTRAMLSAFSGLFTAGTQLEVSP